jgi:hypothetical protein
VRILLTVAPGGAGHLFPLVPVVADALIALIAR